MIEDPQNNLDLNFNELIIEGKNIRITLYTYIILLQ